MLCENFLCIYQSEGFCFAEHISMNRFGMCENCIYPDIDRDTLQKAKMKLLEKYENFDT